MRNRTETGLNDLMCEDRKGDGWLGGGGGDGEEKTDESLMRGLAGVLPVVWPACCRRQILLEHVREPDEYRQEREDRNRNEDDGGDVQDGEVLHSARAGEKEHGEPTGRGDVRGEYGPALHAAGS